MEYLSAGTKKGHFGEVAISGDLTVLHCKYSLDFCYTTQVVFIQEQY